jgi:hypothetical protein
MREEELLAKIEELRRIIEELEDENGDRKVRQSRMGSVPKLGSRHFC